MISVIGAGPAGSHYALNERIINDSDIHIFEEHKLVGKPVACTGILTDSVNSILKIPKELIVSNIERFKIVAPNGKSIYIDLNKKNMVLDRAKFDQFLFSKAVDSGAKAHLGEKFIGYKIKNNHYLLKTSKNIYETDMIVGADGPKSIVAKTAGLYGKRKFIWGWQARAKFPKLEEGTTEIRLDLGEFSWIVPEDKHIARVGVLGVKNKKLLNDYKKLLGTSKIIEDQSGLIPLYNPKQKLRKENIFLIGDAATQVKATTYGGIIYGLIAGKYLAENKETYEKRFNEKLGKDLWISLKMRDFLNHMKEEQANELIEVFQKENNAKILSEHDRDFPSKFVVKLLMKEAKLWKIGFQIFTNKLTKNK
ncbi:MAG: NAD(P)/FAD-dependent oxidoreductase [Candidatus Woesearchaeota archaeon]